ncbi:hypothetical protein vseg_016068 [Gypsophila vaccaria]
MDEFFEVEYQFYWETNMFLRNQELDSWGFEETVSTYYDSSSPDGVASPPGSKNIVSERNRRKKLNERLFALRAVVPKISKMDKASIIKDAISYIQELNEQQRVIKAEISDLEYYRSISNCNNNNNSPSSIDQELPSVLTSPNKKKRVDSGCGAKQYFGATNNTRHNYGVSCRSSTIDDLEMRVSYVGERTVVVSLTCSKKEGTLVKLCEIFELLKLKIITAHITAFAGRLLKTVFLEAEEREKDQLRTKIETAMLSARV